MTATSAPTTSAPTTSAPTTSAPTPQARNPLASSIGWFEVGSPDPAGAQEFYGGLFGWTFAEQAAGVPYVRATTGEGHPLGGGMADTGGQYPAYAVFCVVVEDVAATLEQAVELGGQVVTGPMELPTGIVVGYLRDRDANLLAVYSPVPGQQS
jgi:hypothetical protein